MSEETQNEKGFSTKEFELIQELVKTKMEQNAPIEYESFEGYEVPPRTQFSMLNKPAVSIKFGQITFNMACIRLFDGVEFVLPMISASKKRFLIAMCKEEETSAIPWAKKKNGKWVNKNITAPDFVEDFFKIMGWDRKARYKILAQVVMSERGLALRFDLTEAIMFSAKPDEYVDPRTGATKKRQIKYYPEQYKERYGKTYSDYMAAHPTEDFETLNEYVTMKSLQDVFPGSAVSLTSMQKIGEGKGERMTGGEEQDERIEQTTIT